jgi:adenylylsulfate kinase
MIDSNKRSFMKATTWKIIGFIVLSVLTYTITGSIKDMTLVAVLYHMLMLFLYVFHEKTWNSIAWGRTSGLFVQMTGMSGAGKTTLARALQRRLTKKGLKVEIIDGDEYRKELCEDLGFSKEDRKQNIKRLSFVGKVLGRNNVVCIMSAINPYNSSREKIKQTNFNSKLVYVKCDIEELKRRDTKGLYYRALLPDGDSNKVYNFTGISDPYEAPTNSDLIINTEKLTIEESIKLFEKFVIKHIS